MAVEAAAGCGKTHEALGAAVDLSEGLAKGREVLLLAHTNAAVQVFARRARERRARIRAMTLDAFALELVSPYATPLGLPVPLRMDGPDAVSFKDLAPKVVELLTRAPSIRRSLARHYPVILFDEHQDASRDQHQIAQLFAGTDGCRVRLLGDPMQAIFNFDGAELVPWQEVSDGSSERAPLSEPQRWRKAPDLGQWIMEARKALRAGRALPLSDAPAEVSVRRLADLEDLQPHSRQAPVAAAGIIHDVLRREGPVGILARHTAHVLGIRRAVNRAVPIHEGSDMSRASAFLEKALRAEGNPRRLCELLLALLKDTGAGCNRQFRGSVGKALRADGIEPGRQTRLLPFYESLGRLYADPTARTWCSVVGETLTNPPAGIVFDEPSALRALGSIPPEGNDMREELARIIRTRRSRTRRARKCVSTIHKAKGEEFDHVVVMNCSQTPFPDDEASRHLMYVAVSRAVLSLTLIVPERGGSPLVDALEP